MTRYALERTQAPPAQTPYRATTPQGKARREATRRKILIGAYFLKQAKAQGDLAALYARVHSSLTREHDRRLFCLEACDDASD